MSSIEESLKTYLETEVPSAGKGYPNEVPQNATGWSYFVVSDEQELGHAGGLNFYKARIQLDIVAKPTESASAYKVALGIRQAIRTALDGYEGLMDNVAVEYCKTEISDDWAETQESPGTRIDILINYKM